MRLDSANRSFFALVSAALVPYALLGLLGCGVLSVAAYRVATDGLGGLQRDGQDLRPAVVFFMVVAFGTAGALVSMRRQLRATQALTAFLRPRLAALPPDLAVVVGRAGLAGRVELVDDAEPFSFTYGVVSPRVAVSRGLAGVLAPVELEAVLHHERYHVRNWDTLKVVVARAAPAAFFFLPVLGPCATGIWPVGSWPRTAGRWPRWESGHSPGRCYTSWSGPRGRSSAPRRRWEERRSSTCGSSRSRPAASQRWRRCRGGRGQ